MLVAVAAGLLQQDDLVDAGGLERSDVRAEVGRRADAGRALEGAREVLCAGVIAPASAAAGALLLELAPTAASGPAPRRSSPAR